MRSTGDRKRRQKTVRVTKLDDAALAVDGTVGIENKLALFGSASVPLGFTRLLKAVNRRTRIIDNMVSEHGGRHSL